jgi:hypothetical protein
MAEAMLRQRYNNSIGTQTSDSPDFCVILTNNKMARFYYSKSYRDYVLAFNINSSKSFIITRQMWKILRPHLRYIDHELFFNN